MTAKEILNKIPQEAIDRYSIVHRKLYDDREYIHFEKRNTTIMCNSVQNVAVEKNGWIDIETYNHSGIIFSIKHDNFITVIL